MSANDRAIIHCSAPRRLVDPDVALRSKHMRSTEPDWIPGPDSSSSSSLSCDAPVLARGETCFILCLRVYAARDMRFSTSCESYCKMYIGDTPISAANQQHPASTSRPSRSNTPRHRTFHTCVSRAAEFASAAWDERFDIPLRHLTEVLSIRVKNKQRLEAPPIGSCAIQLEQLAVGKVVDQAFPLFKRREQVGEIRLQLCIQPTREEAARFAPKAPSHDELGRFHALAREDQAFTQRGVRIRQEMDVLQSEPASLAQWNAACDAQWEQYENGRSNGPPAVASSHGEWRDREMPVQQAQRQQQQRIAPVVAPPNPSRHQTTASIAHRDEQRTSNPSATTGANSSGKSRADQFITAGISVGKLLGSADGDSGGAVTTGFKVVKAFMPLVQSRGGRAEDTKAVPADESAAAPQQSSRPSAKQIVGAVSAVSRLVGVGGGDGGEDGDGVTGVLQAGKALMPIFGFLGDKLQKSQQQRQASR